MSDQTQPPEVAIIGAGLAGLSAALALSKHAQQARVSILEKELRFGARPHISPAAR